MPDSSTTKRVVFVHPNGMHQICGALDGDVAPSEITCPFVMLGKLYERAKLVSVTERAVYYQAYEKQSDAVAAPSGGDAETPEPASPSAG